MQPACFDCLILVWCADGRQNSFDFFVLFFSYSFPYFPTLFLVRVVVVYNTVLYSVEIPILFSVLVLLRNHSLVILLGKRDIL